MAASSSTATSSSPTETKANPPLMQVPTSEFTSCSHAQRLIKRGFAAVYDLAIGYRERLGGRAADFATSISVGLRPRHARTRETVRQCRSRVSLYRR